MSGTKYYTYTLLILYNTLVEVLRCLVSFLKGFYMNLNHLIPVNIRYWYETGFLYSKVVSCHILVKYLVCIIGGTFNISVDFWEHVC